MSEPAAPGETLLPSDISNRIVHTREGLFPVIVQSASTKDVLMMAWMDDQALHRTLTTGRATYFSRSRREYWVKGETSGHTQAVVSVRTDCDGDALLMEVEQVGPACHTGTPTCFDAGDSLPVASQEGN